MALIDRLILTLRAQEREDGYKLDRAEITSTSDAYNWLLRYRDEDGAAVWDQFGPDGPPRRREIAKALREMRDRFTREWRERGGRES